MTENKRFTGHYNEFLTWFEDNGEKMTHQQILNTLNELADENEQLKKELNQIKKSNSQDDYIDFLEKQNEMLKERIEELTSHDKIVFMVNE